MAIAVIVGLGFATALTLILVPAIVAIQDDFNDFFHRHFTHAAPAAEPAAPAPTPQPEPAGAGRWALRLRRRVAPRLPS